MSNAADKYFDYFDTGLAHGKAGRYEEAIEAFNQAISIEPDEARAHYNLGICYKKLQLNEEAIRAYKEAIRIDPQYGDAYVNLSLIYSDIEHKVEAINILRQGIEAANEDLSTKSWLYLVLGGMYGSQGCWQETIKACKKSIKTSADFREGAYFKIAFAHRALGQQREEIETYKEFIRIKPDSAAAYDGLGFAYKDSGRYQEAIEAYKQAIKIDPGYAPAHMNLGIAYLSIGDKSSALEEYKILKTLDAEKANTLFNLIYKRNP